MSAVKYVCPNDGCAAKGFDEPGGTKMVCRWHQTRMIQAEAWTGDQNADFRFRKPAKITESGDVVTQKIPDLTNTPEALEFKNLHERAAALGMKVDKRWSLDTLRSNVEHEETKEPA